MIVYIFSQQQHKTRGLQGASPKFQKFVWCRINGGQHNWTVNISRSRRGRNNEAKVSSNHVPWFAAAVPFSLIIICVNLELQMLKNLISFTSGIEKPVAITFLQICFAVNDFTKSRMSFKL